MNLYDDLYKLLEQNLNFSSSSADRIPLPWQVGEWSVIFPGTGGGASIRIVVSRRLDRGQASSFLQISNPSFAWIRWICSGGYSDMGRADLTPRASAVFMWNGRWSRWKLLPDCHLPARPLQGITKSYAFFLG